MKKTLLWVLVSIIIVSMVVIFSLSGCNNIKGKISFTSERDGNFEVYIMNEDGSGQTNLTNNPADDGEPCFSSDRSKIAFESDRDGNLEVYIMNVDGSRQTNLTNNPLVDGLPCFSP